jgi:hypothetical protein
MTGSELLIDGGAMAQNGRRRPSALGYLSPRAFEQQWQDETLAS